MREGAWINIATGRYEWITEHADWMKNPINAKRIRLPDSVFQSIRDIPNDYQGPKRETILRAVMDAGFIRVRGHGDWIAIEFTAPTENALRACTNLMREVCGPLTVLRFNNVHTNESLQMTYQNFEERTQKGDL